jgi:hypothetical protein
MGIFRLVLFLSVFVAGSHLAIAQAAPTAQPAAPPPQVAPAVAPSPMPMRPQSMAGEEPAMPASASKVPMTAPVITVMGACESSKATPKAECKTVLTRAEFELLVKGLDPSMAPQTRKQLANMYAGILARAQEARKRGLDKSPEYLEAVRFAKLEILGKQLAAVSRADAAKATDKEIQDYYNRNTSTFEQVTVDRIFIPKARLFDVVKDNPNDEATKKQAEEVMKKEADELHARAVAGEDFEKLQKEAFETARMTTAPPQVSQSKLRRGSLPINAAAVFDLKPGEVSQIYTDPAGYFIYKMQSRSPAAVADVQDEIRAALTSIHMRDEQQRLRDSVNASLNEEYFGKPSSPTGRPMPMSGQPGVPPRRNGPGAQVMVPPPAPVPHPAPPTTPPQ